MFLEQLSLSKAPVATVLKNKPDKSVQTSQCVWWLKVDVT